MYATAYPKTDNMAKVKINGEMIPCEDVLQIKLVCVNDTLYSEITYRKFEPYYHTECVLIPRDKAYEIEKKVRLARK